MAIINETVTFAEKQYITISIKSLETSELHWHNCIEILLVLSGSIKVTLDFENYELSEDDMILINQGQVHKITSNQNVVIQIFINITAFSPYLNCTTFFHCNSVSCANPAGISSLKKVIAQIIFAKYNEAENQALSVAACAFHLMDILFHEFPRTENSNVQDVKNIYKISMICQYMNEHYTEHLTLNQMADMQYFCPSYFSHLFKQTLGTSFFNYLSSIRLTHAVSALLTTDLSMEQIACDSGFSNYRYFVKAFRQKYKMLPREYRKKKASVSIPEQIAVSDAEEEILMLRKHNFLNKLGHYLDTASDFRDSNIENEKTDKEINLSKIEGTLKHTFKTLTSVGRASELLYSDVQNELRMQAADIGFSYVIFHGILDDSMMLYNEDINGHPYLSFYYVDLLIDFLLSIQLKPVIEFSFMPKNLAKDTKHSIFYNPVILSEPKDEKKWCFLITGLTTHFIKRYGLVNVRTWLFTFWNAPYKSYIYSFPTTEANYHLYEITYKCVKNCDVKLQFGAPSYGPLNFEASEYCDFLDFTRKNNCYPDFYTFHIYPVENATDHDLATFGESRKKTMIILSQDNDSMAHTLDIIDRKLKGYEKHPRYITEWASTTSHRDWLNDTCYRSSFIVKNILENYDRADSFCSWVLSDSIEEMPYENELFHGELGLFANHQIKKPAYYAYCFLSHLKNLLVEKGDGYFITRDNEGNYCMLLYHFIPFSPLYAKGILFNVTSATRYNAFVNPAGKDMRLILKNLTNGTYEITEQIVNRESGSAYDTWIKMGGVSLTSPEELELLKGRSMPGLKKSIITVSKFNYEYNVHLLPHEIRLVELRKESQTSL